MNIPFTHNDILSIPQPFSPKRQTNYNNSQNKNIQEKAFGSPPISVKASNYSSGAQPHHASPSNDSDSFKVFVRWRPLDQKERNLNNPRKRLNILKKQDNMVIFIKIIIIEIFKISRVINIFSFILIEY